jgi:hypothetical protein
MEKITAFIKNNWIWIVLAIVVIYFIYSRKRIKEAEDKAIVAFDKLNGMAAKAKINAEYASEKASLVKLVDNATSKEREVLTDLLNGSIAAFDAAEKEKDKEKAKKDFNAAMGKLKSDLLSKHGEKNVMTFKAKMDKFGFDI